MADGPTGANDDSEEELSPLGAAATLPAGGTPRPDDAKPKRRLRRVGVRLGWVGIVAVVLLFTLVPAFASGLKKTPRDKVGISYGGGLIEGSHFQRIVQPGHALFFNGFFDPLYLYPADQRNYIISKTVGVGDTAKADSVVAPSSDRVAVEYQVAVYFKLNTDRLRAFHEQLGLKYKAFTANGWNKLIQDTFRQQIENALQQETRRYALNEIYSSATRLVKIQKDVQKTLSRRLRDALGQQFFCSPTFEPGKPCEDPTFVVKKIDIPDSVADAFEDNRVSRVKVLTKTNEIAQRTAEAKAIDALNEALAKAGSNYVMLRAIESGSIKFWVIPSGTGLNLTTPSTPDSASPPTTPPTTTAPPTTDAPTPSTTAPPGATGGG